MRRLIAALLFTLTAAGADFAGRWHYTYTTSAGVKREGTFDLKISGNQVGGSMAGERGTIKIEDGQVNGEDIAFRTIRKGNGDEIEIKFDGKIENGLLKLKMNYRTHPTITITATKEL